MSMNSSVHTPSSSEIPNVIPDSAAIMPQAYLLDGILSKGIRDRLYYIPFVDCERLLVGLHPDKAD